MSESDGEQDNRKFEIGMYIAMLLVAVGILGYGAATGKLKDWMQNNQNAAPEAPVEAPAEPVAVPAEPVEASE